MKIERLAGVPGKPVAEMLFGGEWHVFQLTPTPGVEEIFGPIRKDERSAIRAWNSMVKRIRKANAGGKP
jgi:hypothetical protein